ncbi:MAG TPA: helix-turn-helix transcriptional regulator [Streptosporangiaceae bacterium]|jgi:AraC-like DNA-binding protein
MKVIRRRPSGPLEPFVAALVHYSGDQAAGRETRVPDGRAQLVLNLADDRTTCFDAAFTGAEHAGGAALCGPYTAPVGLDSAELRSVICVAFRPGGTYPFFPPAAGALAAPLHDLGDLWGRDGATLAERARAAPTPHAALDVVERALLDHVVRPLRGDPVIAAAAAGLDGGAAVAAVSDRLGMSDRLLRRRFTERTGLAPKRYARTRRMQRLLAAVATAGGPVDWARAAAEHGFYDQAHLIHEFRAFTGGTPAAYRVRAGEPNHVLPEDRPV